MHVHSPPASMTSAAVSHSSVPEAQKELSYWHVSADVVRERQAPKLQPLSPAGEANQAVAQTGVAAAVDLYAQLRSIVV